MSTVTAPLPANPFANCKSRDEALQVFMAESRKIGKHAAGDKAEAMHKALQAAYCAWDDTLHPRSNGNGSSWHPHPADLKVSEKGCVTIKRCHHSRFGLTLYPSTVEYLLSIKEDLEKFIAENRSKLAWKNQD
jgi:hypothetical protein